MTTDPGNPGGTLSTLRIEEEMKESYLTYAMSVLVDRALPDVRDGLKPVHRRILYAMHQLGLEPTAKYRKSALIVGEVLGKYHPHGETAIYDAMVRMAQDFSLRYPLVDGQGNFGSISGDAAAAHRYTEARMSRPALDMLDDLQYETVDSKPNFDGFLTEPVVLPSALPNLIVNGSSGIAVGMATNIPPHNLREVADACLHLLANPGATVDELMRFVQGPDFPTSGSICGRAGIRQAYETGRGRITLRATIERTKDGNADVLVVTEIPYFVKVGTIIESIASADKDGTLTGIARMYDLTGKEGLRLCLELKRGEDPDVVENQLYKHTLLQGTYAINMIALDGGRPRTLGLKRLLQAWLQHRREIIMRRARFMLARDEARLHIVLGLLKAIDIIDEIIALIRAAASAEEAKAGLMERWQFSDRQAQAILDMQLRRLTGLERGKLEAERAELEARIADWRELLASRSRQDKQISDELKALVEKHGDERRTRIVGDAGDLSMEDMIEDEPCVVTITGSSYIKRMPVDTYRVQRRGGKGVTGTNLKDDDDYVAQMFVASNHQYLLCFTTLGKLYWLKVYEVPAASRTSRGRALPNVLSLEQGERITAIVPVRDFPEDRYLFMATAKGTVKKTSLAAFARPRQGGIRAVTLEDGDALIGAAVTSGNDEVLLAATDGQAVHFHESDCRAMGRTAGGVIGMDLAEGAQVVSLLTGTATTDVLSVCQNGYGKRTPLGEYRLTRRGGKGVINISTNERNGPVVASLAVLPDDEIVLTTKLGMVVRTKVGTISTVGRAAAGVTVINLEPNDAVVGVARCPASPDGGDAGGEAGGESATEPNGSGSDVQPGPGADA